MSITVELARQSARARTGAIGVAVIISLLLSIISLFGATAVVHTLSAFVAPLGFGMLWLFAAKYSDSAGRGYGLAAVVALAVSFLPPLTSVLSPIVPTVSALLVAGVLRRDVGLCVAAGLCGIALALAVVMGDTPTAMAETGIDSSAFVIHSVMTLGLIGLLFICLRRVAATPAT